MELSTQKACCFSCCDRQQRRVCFADGARPVWRGFGEQHGCNAGQDLNAFKEKSKQEGEGLEHPWRPALMLATMAQMEPLSMSLAHHLPRLPGLKSV